MIVDKEVMMMMIAVNTITVITVTQQMMKMMMTVIQVYRKVFKKATLDQRKGLSVGDFIETNVTVNYHRHRHQQQQHCHKSIISKYK